MVHGNNLKPANSKTNFVSIAVVILSALIGYILLGSFMHILLIVSVSAGAIVATGFLLLLLFGCFFEMQFMIEKLPIFRSGKHLSQLRSGSPSNVHNTDQPSTARTSSQNIVAGAALGALIYWLPIAFGGAS